MSGCVQSLYVALVALELTRKTRLASNSIDLPAFDFLVLRLKVCSTIPSHEWFLVGGKNEGLPKTMEGQG